MATPDTRNSVVVKKQFTYRGASKVWSNRYHFEGALPSSQAAFESFADLIVAKEKDIYTSEVEIIEAVCYDSASATATNPHGDAVFTKVYTTAGTGTWSAGGKLMPGDCAIYLRYGTPARSKKNHPVYLSNYFHGAWAALGDADNVQADQQAKIETFAAGWLAGYSCDGSPRERCGPRGAVATSYRVDPHVRHRDFPV